MRGEYPIIAAIVPTNSELPPRARRIHLPTHQSHQCEGTTSACAENTGTLAATAAQMGNYLRVRGEYFGISRKSPSVLELPPRARRIPPTEDARGSVGGTTSACAENTSARRLSIFLRRNYLRVRGEYPRRAAIGPMKLELPPRARRIRPQRE